MAIIRHHPCEGLEMYLSLDRLNLVLKTGDHAVQLRDLSLGRSDVLPILSGRALYLIILI